MIEHKERSLPKIVGVPLRWIQGRWNETYYGFPSGKSAREQMDTLLSRERLGLHGVQQLLHLMGETHNSSLQLQMSKKIRVGVDQLVDSRKLPQMDMQAFSDRIDRIAREEGLE